MKLVRYEDFLAMCDQILEEVELTGITYEVRKTGRPVARIEPVDETTRTLHAERRAG